MLTERSIHQLLRKRTFAWLYSTLRTRVEPFV